MTNTLDDDINEILNDNQLYQRAMNEHKIMSFKAFEEILLKSFTKRTVKVMMYALRNQKNYIRLMQDLKE